MKPSDYNFVIGDKVVTVYGDVGFITHICDCDRCKERGFHEPTWMDTYGDQHYITDSDAGCMFDEYVQIGKYKFDRRFKREFVYREINRREKELERWKKRLEVVAEWEVSGIDG